MKQIYDNLTIFGINPDELSVAVVEYRGKNSNGIPDHFNGVPDPNPNTIYFYGPITDDGPERYEAWILRNETQWTCIGITNMQPVDFYSYENESAVEATEVNEEIADSTPVEDVSAEETLFDPNSPGGYQEKYIDGIKSDVEKAAESEISAIEDSNETVEQTKEADNEEDHDKEVAKQMGIDPENPLSKESMDNIKKIMKSAEQALSTFQELWLADAKEYKVTREHLIELHKWNMDHRVPLPEGADETTEKEYDPANGLASITEEECLRIFGEGHPVIGIEHTITIDRITDIYHDWYAFVSAQQEYKEIVNAYNELMELQEEQSIQALKEAAEKEPDPDNKAKMLASIDQYYSNKYVGFMKEPLDDTTKNRIINVLKDGSKAQYLIKRTKDRLKQMNISPNAILEISQFEKRFMDEKYHKCNQCILVYFMNNIVYSNISDKNDIKRARAICLLFALDGIIKGTMKPDKQSEIIENLQAYCDQLIDIVPTPDNC